MFEFLGWLVFIVIVLGALRLVDVVIHIAPHVDGEKLMIIRVKDK